MREIKITEFSAKPVSIWLEEWFILTAGNMEDYNAMAVAWGSFGGMWNKPFAQVVVRPTRYTYEFMEKYDTFTLCSFPEEHRKAVTLLGTKSGRDSDKITESGLTIVSSQKVDTPSFKEANLILECKKIYWQDMDPNHFLDEKVIGQYPQKDYHRIYFGQILGIFAKE